MTKQKISGAGSLSKTQESQFEKKEKVEHFSTYKEKGVGEWEGDKVEVRSGAVLDPGVGQDVVIRNFVIMPQAKSLSGTLEEVLRNSLPMIKINVLKDGWTFLREPTIRKTEKGNYVITTTLTPAIRHGMKIGSTNDTPRNATELLKEASQKK